MWAERFIRFHGPRHPNTMGGRSEIRSYKRRFIRRGPQTGRTSNEISPATAESCGMRSILRSTFAPAGLWIFIPPKAPFLVQAGHFSFKVRTNEKPRPSAWPGLLVGYHLARHASIASLSERLARARGSASRQRRPGAAGSRRLPFWHFSFSRSIFRSGGIKNPKLIGDMHQMQASLTQVHASGKMEQAERRGETMT
jgi:hypothetical protein